MLAISVHTVLLGIMLSRFVSADAGATPAQPTDAQIAPLIRGGLASLPPASLGQAAHLGQTPDDVPTSTVTTAVEPGDAAIRRVAIALASASRQQAGPDAYDRLARKARILERISSPDEVARMADRIRAVLGAEPVLATTRPAAGPFDFDGAVLTSSERIEDDDGVRIIETLTDAAGREQRVVFARRLDPETGETVYEQGIVEPDKEPDLSRSSDGELFTDAEARNRPFAFINRFPLVKQLHRQAVVPILRKLSAEDGQE